MNIFDRLLSFKSRSPEQPVDRDALRALTREIENLKLSLLPMQRALERIESLEHGGRATYVGNGRVLTKAAFPSFNLSFLVEADDRLIAPFLITSGVHEPEIGDHFLRTVKATDHCVDVGANVGYFTCLMGRLAGAGRTLAVEADPKTFELLRDNVAINFLEGATTPICGAVSDREGTLVLHRRVTRSGNTSIIKESSEKLTRLGEVASEEITVDSFTIDSLLDRMDGRIDHIKIDIEGAEPLAFAAISQTLHHNPAIQIVMEWAPGQIMAAGFDLGDFLSRLAGLGLRPAMITLEGPSPISYDDLKASAYLSGVLLTLG